jgi:hypothetical protein
MRARHVTREAAASRWSSGRRTKNGVTPRWEPPQTSKASKVGYWVTAYLSSTHSSPSLAHFIEMADKAASPEYDSDKKVPQEAPSRSMFASLAHTRALSVDERHAKLTEGMLRGGFGVDIGGSVSKVLFFEPSDNKDKAKDAKHRETMKQFLNSNNSSKLYGSSGERDSDLDFTLESGTFHFMKFLTSRMDGAIKIMHTQGLTHEGQIVGATGGGAYKFADDFKQLLGIDFVKADEFGCVVRGVSYLLTTIPKQIYCYVNPRENDLTTFVEHFSPQVRVCGVYGGFPLHKCVFYMHVFVFISLGRVRLSLSAMQLRERHQPAHCAVGDRL